MMAASATMVTVIECITQGESCIVHRWKLFYRVGGRSFCHGAAIVACGGVAVCASERRGRIIISYY